MSEMNPEPTDAISQDEVNAAEAAEQAQLSASQNAYLLKRVVLLRIRSNKLQRQLEEALVELETLRVVTETPGSDDAAAPPEQGITISQDVEVEVGPGEEDDHTH